MAQKFVSNFCIRETKSLSDKYQIMILECQEDTGGFPNIMPGQFVQIRVDNSKNTFLRRPISINDVDVTNKTITLLIRKAGDGTRSICALPTGSSLNLIWPLGNGFSTDINSDSRVLLLGGGVGVAPLLYLGKILKQLGHTPEFLLGAQKATDLLLLDKFEEIGSVHISTDDGSHGEKGLVTTNSILETHIDKIFCCGPLPMMKGVATLCKNRGIDCEVSLENVMACGVGACLCCVEPTVKGNRCVCTEGPVFNIKELLW
ncbi:MAG: dihydroorotate dehydrogenase electron transfer subunit [Bacteroidales bacterium]|nr:dihydroorotate dehydrogenase electron transfer subunit [Bacteroidales bacterium]